MFLKGGRRSGRCGGRRVFLPLVFIFLLVPSPPLARSARGSNPTTVGRSVQKTPSPDGFHIDYTWTDPRGALQKIEMSISRSDLDASERAQGFSVGELREFLIDCELKIREEEGVSALDIAKEVVERSSDLGSYRVSKDPTSDFNFIMRTNSSGRPESAVDADIERMIRAYRQRWEASQKKIDARLETKLMEYAEMHGMKIGPRGIAVDYKNLVRANVARLRPLAEEFKRTCGSSKKKLLEAVLSFVQNIPYRKMPPVADGKYSAGVAVPLRVLADDAGDCDSKAVLFASLWLSLCKYRTILIRIPEHMLVGVAMPFVEGASIELHSTRYVLLELSCGITLLPGEVIQYTADFLRSQNFKYQIVS
jgi:hypothetical protein